MKSAKSRKVWKGSALLLLLALLLSCLTGCQWHSLVSDETTKEAIHVDATPEVQETEATTTEPPEVTVLYYHPLTGLACEESLSTSRPISVCIGNGASDLPQYGLSAADILIEAPVNHETRLNAIFTNYRAASCIGNIRSTRRWLVHLSNAFGAVAIYSGTTDIAGEEAEIFPNTDSFDYLKAPQGSLFYRDTSRVFPYNVMSSGDRIADALADSSFAKTTLGALPYVLSAEGGKALLSGQDALRIRASLASSHSCEFQYDAKKGEYLRFQNGVPHMDSANGKQLAFTNLFFLFCNFKDDVTASGSSVMLNTESGGEGYYISGGMAMKIRWCMEGGQIRFTDAGGKTITVSCGNSYIGLLKVSDAQGLSIQ